jgi:hypothetical protein
MAAKGKLVEFFKDKEDDIICIKKFEIGNKK